MDTSHPIPFLRAPLGAELPHAAIEAALEAAREATDMDIAFFAELTGEDLVFRALTGDAESFGWSPRDTVPLDTAYCTRMVTGELSNVVPDAHDDALAMTLEVTATASIRSYVGAPVWRSDGLLYGSFCVLSHDARPDLSDRDARLLAALGRLVARQIEEHERNVGDFRQIVEAIAEGVWLADLDGVTRYVNGALTELLGRTAPEMMGRSVLDLVPEQDRAHALEHMAQSRRGVRSSFAIRQARPDGEIRHLQVASVPLSDPSGTVTGAVSTVTDVTDARAQQRLTALVDSSADAIISHDLQGRITSWNAAATRIYGYAPEEAIGQTIACVLPGERPGEAEPLLAEIRAGRAVPRIEASRHRADGGHHVLSLAMSPVRAQDDSVVGGSIIARDVTQRHHAEQQVRLSEARLLEAQQVARVGHWEIHRPEQVVDCSAEARRLLNLPSAPTPLEPETFFAGIHPEDVEAVRRVTDAALARGGDFAYEHRVKLGGDEIRWITARGSVIHDQDGKPHKIVGTVQDVTDLRRTEADLRQERERLSEAQRVARMGDFVWDLDSHGLALSAELVRLLGIRPGSRFTPRDYVARVPEPEREALIEAFRRGATTGTALEHDHSFRRADGKSLLLNVRGEVKLDADGTPRRAKGTVQDVTRQRAAEHALRARDEAERANAAKSEFLSRMSHELRTPLNAILGFGQLLELDDGLDADAVDSVTHILSAGRHLLELINEVLDLSRIEAGVMRLELEPIDVEPLARDVVDLLAPLAAERGISLRLDADEETCALADSQRLKQILLNLVHNAIKYNRPDGAVDVAVSRAGDSVVIGVRDTGRGIAEDQLLRLFDPFDRLDAEGSDVVGSGLGLAVSRSLAEAMHGTIEAQGAVGAGSVFTVTLPHAGR